MALIDISHLTFGFDAEAIFDDVSVQLDTDWRLGLIGRNGRGKTTFLRLLQGAYPCVGTITANTAFDYFPFDVEDTAQDTLSVVRAAIAPFDRWEARMAFLAARGDEAAMQEYGEVYERGRIHHRRADRPRGGPARRTGGGPRPAIFHTQLRRTDEASPRGAFPEKEQLSAH